MTRRPWRGLEHFRSPNSSTRRPWRGLEHFRKPNSLTRRPWRGLEHFRSPNSSTRRPWRGLEHFRSPNSSTRRPWRGLEHFRNPNSSTRGPWRDVEHFQRPLMYCRIQLTRGPPRTNVRKRALKQRCPTLLIFGLVFKIIVGTTRQLFITGEQFCIGKYNAISALQVPGRICVCPRTQ